MLYNQSIRSKYVGERDQNRAVREERGLNDGLPLYLEKETTEYRIRHACLVCGDYMYFVTGREI